MDCLPLEVKNIIYEYRAVYNLRNLCIAYQLDFDSLIEFLIRYNGSIYGSCAICCIISRGSFNDINIWVTLSSEDKNQQIWKEFSKIFLPGNYIPPPDNYSERKTMIIRANPVSMSYIIVYPCTSDIRDSHFARNLDIDLFIITYL